MKASEKIRNDIVPTKQKPLTQWHKVGCRTHEPAQNSKLIFLVQTCQSTASIDMAALYKDVSHPFKFGSRRNTPYSSKRLSDLDDWCGVLFIGHGPSMP